jgi:hypothetical protein
MTDEKALTVREAAYDLLRTLELTTIFGTPGATEQQLLNNCTSAFDYILALHFAMERTRLSKILQPSRRRPTSPQLISLISISFLWRKAMAWLPSRRRRTREFGRSSDRP